MVGGCVCVCVCVCLCVYVCVYTCVCLHVCIHCVCVCGVCVMCVWVHACTHACACACVCVRVYACLHVCTCLFMHFVLSAISDTFLRRYLYLRFYFVICSGSSRHCQPTTRNGKQRAAPVLKWSPGNTFPFSLYKTCT